MVDISQSRDSFADIDINDNRNHEEKDLETSHGQEVGSSPTPIENWKPTKHDLMIMATLSTISLMVSLDASIIITSLPTLVNDLGGTATQGFWVGTSYLLANAVTMPVIAAISNIFGRPHCLIFALVFFTAGSLLCCLAQNMTVMLVGRSIQGVGGGGIVIIGLVIFTDMVPLRYRPKWYGTVLGAWAIGTCIGPLIGGLIVQHTTWRWIFYLMFPFCGIGLVAVPLLLSLEPPKRKLEDKLSRIDWTGAALFIGSAGAFLIAISWGGSEYAWRSAATLAPLCVGVAGLFVTVLWEKYRARIPFFKHSLFRDWSSVAAYLYGQLYYIPFYFLSVRLFSPTKTGIALFPALFTLVPASIVVGVLITRTARYRWAIWGGWALLTLGTGLTLLWTPRTPRARWAATLVAVGVGHGSVLNAQNFATQAMCAEGEEGAAAAMYGFVRQLGMALGVGIGGSAFQNVMRMRLRRRGLDEGIARDAEAFVYRVLAGLPEGEEKAQLEEAYAFGLRGVFAVYLGISGVALLLSFVIRHVNMDKQIKSEHQLRKIRILE
ncbi:major facilitator superfamily transporter [Xylariaceae sp. FL0016]|nr:major facilitator superfamily transporter [Xylariaceae sp. FL0016]